MKSSEIVDLRLASPINCVAEVTYMKQRVITFYTNTDLIIQEPEQVANAVVTGLPRLKQTSLGNIDLISATE